MGVQVEIDVSWDEVDALSAIHQHEELWVHVLSTQPMKPTNVLPEEVSSQITPEVLAGYNHRTVCGWFPDERPDDEPSIAVWLYEQHWVLPKMRTTA